MPSETIALEWETIHVIRARYWKVLRRGIRVVEATVEETKLNSGLKLDDLSAKPSDLKPLFATSKRLSSR